MYMKTNKACMELGVHPNTLRSWANDGKIKYIRQPGGQRCYDVSSVGNADIARKRICYCRVSSAKQRDDLARQIAFMRDKFPEHDIVSDVGSGINFKRKGLEAILEQSMQGNISEVVVAHRDRLCRFGFDLIRLIIEKNGGKLVVLNDLQSSPEKELVNDLVSIIHVFACRIHGLRKYTTAISKDTDLSNSLSEAEAPADDGNGKIHVQPDGELPE